MNPRLVQAFNNVGVADPVPYVQEALDRLDKIAQAIAEEQRISNAMLTIGNNQSIPAAKAFLHTII